MTTHIYALVDPVTREIFYVGKANNPHKRLNGHIKVGRNPERIRRIAAIMAAGSMPEVEVIETVEYETWEDRERFWISELGQLGFPLTNISPGGAGPGFIPFKRRPAQSLARKGVPMRESTKQILSASHKVNPKVREHMDKLHAAKKGIPRTKAEKEKLSEAVRNSPIAIAARKAAGEKRRGKPMHENTMKAMVACRKGIPLSEEHRKAVSKALFGKPLSVEHRETLRAARMAYVDRIRIAVAGGADKETAKKMAKLPTNWRRATKHAELK